MERLINLINVVSVFLMLVVVLSLRRQRIRPEYAVAWLGACAALFVLSRWTGPALWLQNALGLPDRPLALILIVFAVFMVVFYRFTVRISDLKDANIALAQRMAILEYHLQSLHEKKQEQPGISTDGRRS
ncbi:hypothetical protein F183_A42530 [Bryobacterales bacterium F-183]|nr:hypothetical protein F183_A42530 [Bryobacterales bacterium F-183]